MGARHQTLHAPLLLLVCAVATVRAAPDGAGNTQAAGTGSTLCCTNATGYHECVEACFAYYPREQAEKFCDPGCQEAYQCRTVSGDRCPSSGQPSSDLLIADDSEVGDLVVQAAVATTLCCSNMTGFHECVEDCFAYFPREQADKICDTGCKEAYQCQTVSGDKCPSGHLAANSANGDAVVGKCVSGCRSSVCSKMVTGVGSKLVAVKHALERCNNACNNFCTKGGVRARTSAA